MRLKFIFLVSLFLIVVTISAQQTTGLVEPSAEDYLSTVVDLYRDLDTPYSEKRDLSAIAQLEVEYRYDVDALSYSELRDLTVLLNQNSHWYNPFFGDADGTHFALSMAYIQDNNISLDAQEMLIFDEYILNITPIDFSGDGQSEYLIDMTWYEYSHRAYWLIENTNSGYRRVQTPQLWFNETCNFRTGCSGNATLLQISDVNSDGLNEIVIARGGSCGYGECGGSLEIWAWRNGAMREIAPRRDRFDLFWTDDSTGDVAILPPDGTWLFSNVDDDEALELIQDRTFDDNRGCVINNLRIFDWLPEEDVYASGEITETYEDSVGCGLRVGHVSMLEGDYSTAIMSYQRVLELIEANSDDEYLLYARQYAQIRLGIAFALNGDVETATQQIEIVSGLEPVSEVINQMIHALRTYLDNQNALIMCSAVYDSLKYSPDHDYVNDFLFQQIAGLDDVSNRPGAYVGLQFDPVQSGCDVSGYALRLMQSEGLEAVEDIANTVEVIAFDINNDGIQDVIRWFDLILGGYFFLSNGDNYIISYLPSAAPNDNFDFEVQYLPDGTSVLLSIRNNPIENVCSLNNSNYGRLYIDILTDENKLRNLNSFYICNEISLENYDLSSGQLNVWDYFGDEFISLWHDDSYTSEAESEEFTTLEESIVERGLFSCGNETGFCAFNAEPDYALEVINSYFANQQDYPENHFFDLALTYYQALLFEQLGRYDEALIAYQELSQSDTIWGQMANLHLEQEN